MILRLLAEDNARGSKANLLLPVADDESVAEDAFVVASVLLNILLMSCSHVSVEEEDLLLPTAVLLPLLFLCCTELSVGSSKCFSTRYWSADSFMSGSDNSAVIGSSN